MPSLRSADDRFGVRIEILEGGSGFFTGILDEPNQGQLPSYQFTHQRRILRVDPDFPLPVASVIKAPSAVVFMVGELGDSEEIFKSYRLFRADKQYTWQTRTKTIEPVTLLETDEKLTDPVMIWGAYEPAPEAFDRQVRSSFETGRFVTNRPVKLDDIVDGRRVTRSDPLLGLYILTLG